MEGKDHLEILWIEGPKYNKYFKLPLFKNIFEDEEVSLEQLHSQTNRIQGTLETTQASFYRSTTRAR